MPNPKDLKVGDRIRLVAVPAADLAQREREVRDGVEMAGWTADTIERILRESPVVTITWIDEFGTPWFDAELVDPSDQAVVKHSIAVMDQDSWRLAD